MFLLLLLACQDATFASADDAPTVTILRPANGAGFAGAVKARLEP